MLPALFSRPCRSGPAFADVLSLEVQPAGVEGAVGYHAAVAEAVLGRAGKLLRRLGRRRRRDIGGDARGPVAADPAE